MLNIKGLFIFLGVTLGAQLSFSAWALQFDQRPITPIPTNPKVDKTESKNIALGKQLFNDTRLSANNRFSCATCHAFKSGGSVPQTVGNLKIPSIFNADYNFKAFWNASADTLEDAVKINLLNPKMMGFNPKTDLEKLTQGKDYSSNLTFEKIVSALTSYIKTLRTPGSRFDQYLSGKTQALTEPEKKGYALFQSYGCISCHQGVLVGGNILQKFGIYNNYFSKKPKLENFDLGYYNVTKNINDKFVFRVPSLRNVALTAPYFHDSSVPTLNEAIEKMALYQIGHPIPTEDVKLIVEFLNTLTGQIPEK